MRPAVTPAVRCRQLTKIYNPRSAHELCALDAADFEVQEGEIFGLIGSDGAGKTTTFKILAGVMERTSGEIEVLGDTPRRQRHRIGFLSQPFSLYQDLSVAENLRYVAGLRRVAEEDFERRTRHYLELFAMTPFAERLAGRLSGGMKQKLALSCALVAGPRILLLDEPTSGVDPVSRRDFWDAMSALSQEGITIIVATPYLDEAERCTRIACMEGGHILDIDSPRRFRSKLGVTRLGIRTGDLATTEDVLGAEGAAAGCIRDVQRFGDRLDVMVANPQTDEPRIRAYLQQRGLTVEECRQAEPTLENAFVTTLRGQRESGPLPPFPQPGTPSGLARGSAVGIGAYGLNKRFGSFHAVKNLDIEVRHGEIYGLLGANGAGKTTAIKMICGLLAPTSGQVSVLGHKKRLRSAEVRRKIGYKSQKFSLYDDLTLEQNLDFYASMYGVPPSLRPRRKKWVLEVSGLAGQERLLTGKLPDGWKQRVAFGAAVMHEPEVVLLDEPTSGVDALARRSLWRMINDLADRGAVVLVVTHYLEEAEQCNRLGFMVSGSLVAEGSPGDVKTRTNKHLLEVETTDCTGALALLKAELGPQRVSLFGDLLHVVTDEPQQGGRAVRDLLGRHSIGVTRLDPIDFSLEDVFISLMHEHAPEPV